MSTTLRIAEVAARAGITTATVRYYERIGVLPRAPRTGNGYRHYDEHVVERLAFVGRAKQLGCTLEEIADLATAWDGGRCGPVQDRLRVLVAEKVRSAQTEIVDLVALVADLRRAAAALERHRPTGACDERCGCISEPADAAPDDIAVALTGRRGPSTEQPIACTLPTDLMPDRLDTWNRLLAGAVTSRAAIDGGLRLALAAGTDITAVARLAAAEHDCCRFFGFALTVDGRGVGLEVTAPPDGQGVLAAVFGAPA